MEEINEQNQKYVELELLNQQLGELENTLFLADEHINQLQLAKDAIENLETIKKGKENSENILVPISAGIFLPVSGVDLEKIKVSVGANIVVEKNSKETLKIIDKHIKNMSEHKEKTIELFDKVSLKAIKLQEEIQKNI
jgi:prefoldin alpha subunit